jgi:quercetin dioxygenase-like cupin family protein
MNSDVHCISDLAGLLPALPEESILSRHVLSNDALNVTLFGFAAGQELTEHSAAFPAVLHFLDGEFELVLGDEELEARAGAWIYMPAHLPHSIRARSKGSFLLTLVLCAGKK